MNNTLQKIYQALLNTIGLIGYLFHQFIYTPLKSLVKRFTPEHMVKPMTVMLLSVFLLFGMVSGFKMFKTFMINRFFASQANPVYTVATIKAPFQVWTPEIKAVGSTRTTLGVNITAQLGGQIQKIYFTPGSIVEAGTLLVQQNADPNIGQLHALQASMELAKITYFRDKKQYRARGISKQQLDSDLQNWKSYQGQVEQQAAVVKQLTISAPFKGRLGVSLVNPGQYLNPGDTVVNLQSLDPIYVDFYLPQNQLGNVAVGQNVTITLDAFKDKKFIGKVTTINPIVEKDTRNVEVEATVPNPDMILLPGMFTTVYVNRGVTEKYITLPKAAVTFNPYGDLVYFITGTPQKKNGKEVFVAKQKFVTVGESRGDQVSIIDGIKEGEEIITGGQLKLKNGSLVAINNTVQPGDTANPPVPNQHGLGK